jgi:hypothetical protein
MLATDSAPALTALPFAHQRRGHPLNAEVGGTARANRRERGCYRDQCRWPHPRPSGGLHPPQRLAVAARGPASASVRGVCAAAPLRVTLSQLPALRLIWRSAIMRDMGLGIAPIIHGDYAESCTACGHTFGPGEPIFVAGQSWPETRRGHAVCDACKPTTTRWGHAPEWNSFACRNCGRTVHYLQGREYRCCTYRCAAAIWTKRAIQRRSRSRAEARVKEMACEACGCTFTATRTDARYCSATCRQRAHRGAGTARPQREPISVSVERR